MMAMNYNVALDLNEKKESRKESVVIDRDIIAQLNRASNSSLKIH